ncbi:Mfa1 family fimbria major subunit [Bacteroides sp.]|uniref:Mfa1 family fimbria major subunit n=1 Tax=Bacteroides sp. TaxID=29523 RepID=UPI0025B7FF18|nr:Mfa1 family fimbria major subunit [Bacteroides sp.]
MELRSLFLAGLAVMAMASCSNDVEGVDNNVEPMKDAKMQLAVTFPQATATRAGLTNDQKGEPYEQKINDLTIIVVNGASTVREYYTADQLVEGKEDGTHKNMTPAFDVPSGSATVYAYANYGEGTITTTNYTTYEESATYTGLSIDNNIANVVDENFHMNGSTSSVTITEGITNYALVNISRVAAKITEATVTKAYTHEGKYGDDLTITLTDYSLVNLDKKAKILADDTDNRIEADFYNYYAGTENTSCEDLFTNKPHISIDAENTTSYCLANQSSIKTQVIYKAKATFSGSVTEADGTFYIRNNRDNVATVYTLSQLQAAFPGVYNDYTADTTIADWAALGVKKYAAGVCYYKQDVTTDGIAKVLRNNYYKLNVTNIRDLGDPEIDMPNPDPLTLLEVEVKVMPWTVWNNDIEL